MSELTVLTKETCCVCFVEFGVPAGMQAQRREDHASFYCPNGHSQSYTGKSKADALAEELSRTRQRLAQKTDELAEANAEAARLKKRASVGVCPCCNRSFSQLAEHMAAKHPELVRETGTVVRLREKRTVAGAAKETRGVIVPTRYDTGVGQRVTQMLARACLTQEDLARRLGVSKSHANQLITGRCAPGEDFEARVRAALGQDDRGEKHG